MNADLPNKTYQEEQPLTRTDVERLLQEVGSSKKLILSGRNLRGINLSGFNLMEADLQEANLRGADLSSANLYRAQLIKANLIEANLFKTNLREANLKEANLSDASVRLASLHGSILVRAILIRTNLSGAELSGANLSQANLHEANLYHTGLSRANLSGADLSKADLLGASLFGANLQGADFKDAELLEANLSEATMFEGERELLANRGVLGFKQIKVISELILRMRILEKPLTAQNLTTIISALTELSTKYWLIAKGRFADLIEYTQTHNSRFAEEANVVVAKVTYNSPFNMDWKVDLSAPSVAEALVTTIDGITQAPQRLKQKELENQAKTQEIQQAEQQAAHEQQMALLEREQRRLEIEKQRLEILEKQLEVQKKGIEYALEIAGKVVDLLHPSADPATRAMEIQALLPNLVQLQNGKGLELALPLSHNEQSTAPKEG